MLRNVLPISLSPSTLPSTNLTNSSMTMTPVTISTEPINSLFLTRHDTVDFLHNQTLNYYDTDFNVFDNCNGTNCLDVFPVEAIKDIKLDVYQEKYGEVIRLELFEIPPVCLKQFTQPRICSTDLGYFICKPFRTCRPTVQSVWRCFWIGRSLQKGISTR